MFQVGDKVLVKKSYDDKWHRATVTAISDDKQFVDLSAGRLTWTNVAVQYVKAV